MYQRVPSKQVLMKTLKIREKKMWCRKVEENANVSFLRPDNHGALVCSALLTAENLRRSTSRTLLVKLEWIAFGCVHKLYPEESDCVPAVRRPKLVPVTGLIVRQ